ncbi:hypothetical protein [Novosphingobium beihaiensis]|uniref:Uncharacterized protein n=1 Tax=Novosphingobium beihaiensis TaxID=2930389 RepID=A0ABT0BUT9_9SPHN|nr:hypothetical protein [Novosphingobium beihaiensis]MCJ2188816.1 hypothetical protein [Novosphingobium beihaiensis]
MPAGTMPPASAVAASNVLSALPLARAFPRPFINSSLPSSKPDAAPNLFANAKRLQLLLVRFDDGARLYSCTDAKKVPWRAFSRIWRRGSAKA